LKLWPFGVSRAFSPHTLVPLALRRTYNGLRGLGHANFGITLDIYSHVLPGMQEAAAEKFDRLFGADVSENSDANVSNCSPKQERAM